MGVPATNSQPACRSAPGGKGSSDLAALPDSAQPCRRARERFWTLKFVAPAYEPELLLFERIAINQTRGNAAIRPESVVKPTGKEPTRLDPERTLVDRLII